MAAVNPLFAAVVNSCHSHKRDHRAVPKKGGYDIEVINPFLASAEEDRYREHDARRHEFHQLTIVVHCHFLFQVNGPLRDQREYTTS